MMISSTLKVIGCLFAVCFVVCAQSPTKKIQTGTVSGKITVKGNGVAGVLVGARAWNGSRQKGPRVAATDQHGNYRLTNLEPAQYEVGPAAPQFVVAGYQPVKKLIVAEGENVEGIDFALIRGGAITGKVTDGDGRPVIEEGVEIIGPEGPNQDPFARLQQTFQMTDDRGIYRLYGLAPGKYKVSSGISADQLQFGGLRRSLYSQTFHPSTSDLTKATVIEVTEGGEATNVDIVVRRSQPFFTVRGRIVDESGKPVADVRVGLQKFRENGIAASSGPTSNRHGEVILENVTPGKYALFLEGSFNSDRHRDLYAEPVLFDVVDADVTNLVLKTTTTASLSGVVVMEGMDEKARSKINGVMVFAHNSTEDRADGGSIGFSQSANGVVNPDGSFTVVGMRPGVIQLGVHVLSASQATEFEITRIERDGVVLPGIEIKDREQIKGLRLTVESRSGRIRGVVKLENGQLSNMYVHVSVKKVGDDGTPASGMDVDDRGRFLSRPLAPGLYEVMVMAFPPRYRGESPMAKQQVVIADNQVTEVTLTLDVKPKSYDEEDEDGP